MDRVYQLNQEGMRVVGVAQKSDLVVSGSGVDDRRDMVLIGYLAFLDPPKLAKAIAELSQKEGVQVRCSPVTTRASLPPSRKDWASTLTELLLGSV